MTREQQLRAARRLLGLPHPADDDEVIKALRYIEFRDRLFLATKKRSSKPAKRAARGLVRALLRAQQAGVMMPADWETLVVMYHDMSTSKSGPPARADGFKQRLALQSAFWMLRDRKRPCAISLNGDWCKLAAILLGYSKPSDGLFAQARKLKAILLD